MNRDLMDRTIVSMMTRGPRTVPPEMLAAEALAFMNEKKITQLFVLDPDDKTKKPAGILHMHDCLRAGIQ
jgi:arabinose-5-phosphate isomerase